MFNQIPYMMANPMYTAAPIIGNAASSAAPGALAAATKGTSLLGKLNWSSLLSNAQKTLNVVNQAIPLYYQVKPVFNNIKTLGKIGREFTKAGSVSTTNTESINTSEPQGASNNINDSSLSSVPNPTFFL